MFGRLMVVCPTGERKNDSVVWECKCVCGNVIYVPTDYLSNGHKKSCGCLRTEHATAVGHKQMKHGATNYPNRQDRLYGIWANMKYRCNSGTAPNYGRYGGRGIVVCDEWDDYINFRDWSLDNGYSDDLTIDRINNDGNYEPSNCQWITREENTRKDGYTRSKSWRNGG